MSLPRVDPSLPTNPAPIFSDVDAARGDHLRANNNIIWQNLTYLDNKTAAQSGSAAANIPLWNNVAEPRLSDSGISIGALPPIGSIIAYLSGYFTNGSNGSFTPVAQTLPGNWRVCDGSALNLAASPLYNGGSRYLPNLTDSRFLMGSVSPGDVGGANSVQLSSGNLPTHTHTIPQMTTGGQSQNHTHDYFGVKPTGAPTAGRAEYSLDMGNLATGGTSIDHYHITSDGYSTGIGAFANTAFENRPLYLSVKYIQRVF